jgi:hypothetical protein
MSVAALAGPDESTVGGFLTLCLIYAFMTPFGWGALIVIIYLICSLGSKATKTIASTDYSEMKEDEKEVLMKEEFRNYTKSLK